MNLKLDENLGHSAAQVFLQAGHDVETVSAEGLAGAIDDEILAACRTERRCLVTLDLDFSNPLIFRASEEFGIAVLRVPAKPTPADLLLLCKTLTVALGQNNIVGKLWSVQRGRVREYRPEE